jgi:hypothetical protein
MSNKKLLEIERLLDSVFESERVALASLARKEQELRQKLADLSNAKHEKLVGQEAGNNLALVTDVDMKWHRWIDQRRETMNRELAQVLALKLDQEPRLKIAFGRREACRSLVKNGKAAAKALASRRGDQTS